jgi:16S rRNA processing protein RimM
MTPPGDADELAFPDDAIEVGRVLGAWGIKGGIRVQPFSKDPEALLSAKRWFIRPPEGLGAKLGVLSFPPSLRVTHSKVHGDSVVATAQQLPDRNAAEAMQGARIFISRSNFPSAGDGEFYWIDLIGLAVVNRQGEALGTVTDLIDTGAHSVLRLRRPDAVEGASLEASERLIPFVAAFIDDVSLAERRITVDWVLDF